MHPNQKTLKQRLLDQIERNFLKKEKMSKNLKVETEFMSNILDDELRYDYLENKFLDKNLIKLAQRSVIQDLY